MTTVRISVSITRIGSMLAGLGLIAMPLAFASAQTGPSLSIQSLSPGGTVSPGTEVSFSIIASGLTTSPSYTINDSFSGSSVSSNDINASGVFAWIPTANDGGTHTITVVATDSANDIVTATQTIIVNIVPTVSIQSLSPGQTTNVGSSVFFSANAIGFTNPTYTIGDSFSNSSLASSAINSVGGFSWTPKLRDVGTHTITVVATDAFGNSANATQAIIVNAPASISVQSLSPGATTTPGQTVTFSVAPSGLSNPTYYVSDMFTGTSVTGTAINASGSFSWTPNVNDLGIHTIVVQANDSSGSGQTATVSQTIAVVSATSTQAQTSTLIATTTASAPTITATIPTTTLATAPAPYVFLSPLQVGSTGADVTALQDILIRAGYLTGAATGYYGLLTQTAVENYQTAHGLAPVGVVGPATRAALNQESGTSTPSSSSSNATARQQLIQLLLQQLHVLEAKIAQLQSAQQ